LADGGLRTRTIASGAMGDRVFAVAAHARRVGQAAV